MLKTKIIKNSVRAVIVVLLSSISLLSLSIINEAHGDLAEAEGFENSSNATGLSFPYEHTFTISAYYSPLPCQQRYATGSYESEIRLNGNGVHGADGTPVFPGMIAAPKIYPFNTKLYIPGVGIVSVHDRGGAIVTTNGQEGLYDRLDIWMGYGDEGLVRALKWGKKTVTSTIYGINNEMNEQISLEGYSQSESNPSSCSAPDANQNSQNGLSPQFPEPKISYPKFDKVLSLGNKGSDVTFLQNELKALNFYRAPVNGMYDQLTEHAVFKFQQSQGIVGDMNYVGAGVVGPVTRKKLNQIIVSRNKRNQIVKVSEHPLEN
ncbi:peptidoglycan-binding protein [Candidatus Peregrinibacteria bacterium]|nr:peptidoglycan-binding protein [Candidatus Peregrinibacteria bacterium]